MKLDIFSLEGKDFYSFDYMSFSKFIKLEKNHYEEMFFNLRTSENNLDKGFFQDLNLYIFVKIDSLDNLKDPKFKLKKMEIEESQYYGQKRVIYYTDEYIKKIDKELHLYGVEKLGGVGNLSNLNPEQKFLIDMIS